MRKVLVVSSEKGQIETEDLDELNLATGRELDAIIQASEQEVAAIFSNTKAVDPSMKKCSRCVKQGRVGIYPLDNFSVKQDGKLHSQCKVCRTEQATEWVNKQGEKRKQYSREYREKNADKLKIFSAARRIQKERAELEAPSSEPVKRDDVLFVMSDV